MGSFTRTRPGSVLVAVHEQKHGHPMDTGGLFIGRRYAEGGERLFEKDPAEFAGDRA